MKRFRDFVVEKVSHPFEGGVKKSITKKHRPLVWENMLGTVQSASPQGKVKYHDYDWDAAHAHANVAGHTDLRIARTPRYSYYGGEGPRPGKLALWGVPR